MEAKGTEIQDFGDWTVQKAISGNRVFIVHRNDDLKDYVLKTNADRTPAKIKNEIEILQRLNESPHTPQIVDYEMETSYPWHVTAYEAAIPWEDVKLSSLNRDQLKNISPAKLFIAAGFIHSRGVSLGGDIEICITSDYRWFFFDFEYATLYAHHHFDTHWDMMKLNPICQEIDQKRKKVLAK